MVIKNKGFTLIEVMIVVTIIGVLAAIAYPSYAEYVRKTKRLEVQAELMDVSKKLQRYKVSNFRYLQANAGTVRFIVRIRFFFFYPVPLHLPIHNQSR